VALATLIVPLIKFEVVGAAILATAGVLTVGCGFIGAPVPTNYWAATAYDLTQLDQYAHLLLSTVAMRG